MIGLALIMALSAIPDRDASGKPTLRSETVVVRYADTGEVLLSKNPNVVRPIASVTKLLSGLILTTQAIDREQAVVMLEDDKDRLKWARSRLPVSISMSWGDMLRAGLGASDNRAIYATVRTLMPRDKFVDLMNAKAKELGMASSHFVDPAGLDPGNVSTAMDLMRLLDAAAKQDDLCTILLTPEIQLNTSKGEMFMRNPDRLVHSTNWDIVIGKTGYTVEAGRTFAVRMRLGGRLVDMVFLGSREMQSVFGDAGRIRRWLEPQIAAKASNAPTGTPPMLTAPGPTPPSP
jgi:D-alanyl-D-alanine endopeptidase (penicillin-binding protein 7)